MVTAAIFLLISFLGLGTGALSYLHELQHEHEDAQAGHDDRHAPVHDESNCFVHAQLHLPTVSVGWVPLLICLGLFVAFVTELAPPLVSQRAFFRIACRGPPAC